MKIAINYLKSALADNSELIKMDTTTKFMKNVCRENMKSIKKAINALKQVKEEGK